jgi:hypothetical protein
MASSDFRDIPPGLRQVLKNKQERAIFRRFTDSQAESDTISRYLPREMDFDRQRSVLQPPQTHLLNRQIISGCMLLKPDLKKQDYTWDAVLETIHAANEVYRSKAGTNILRRIVRKGQPAASLLIGACELIPDEKGLSAIKAGLVIIFEVRTWP